MDRMRLMGSVLLPGVLRGAGTCPEGEIRVDGKCVAARKRRGTCPDGQDEVDGKCPARKRRGTCPDGQDEVDGKCVAARKRRGTCPSGQKMNAVTEKCE